MSNQHSEPKFDTERYSAKPNTYLELADAYANNLKTYVSFHHVDSGREVYFKAFITNLVETYNCDWTKESIFGRIDPVPIFKQNERIITLNIKIPAATIGEAYENLGNVQQVIQFMYPNYTLDSSGDSSLITKPPYVRMKVMNLIRDVSWDTSAEGEVDEEEAKPIEQKFYNQYKTEAGADRGLLGFIRNCTVLHNLESEDGVFEKAQNTILPKLIELAITFGVIHENAIGHSIGNEGDILSMPVFPYGVTMPGTSEASAQEQLEQAYSTGVEAEADAQFDEYGNLIIPETNSNAGGSAQVDLPEADASNIIDSLKTING